MNVCNSVTTIVHVVRAQNDVSFLFPRCFQVTTAAELAAAASWSAAEAEALALAASAAALQEEEATARPRSRE